MNKQGIFTSTAASLAAAPNAQAALHARRDFLKRTAMLAAPLAMPAAFLPSNAKASQLEEPLVDSVRSALSAAISNSNPPEPVFATTAARLHYVRWLTATSSKLERRMPNVVHRHEFLQTIWYESKRAGLDTSMVLGLVQVESGFKKYAISPVGARGFMQIMPFWTRVIGDGDPQKLFHMQTNLRFGNVILRHYLDIEKGNLYMALGRYNGSRGKAVYPNAVFAAQRQWEFTDPYQNETDASAPTA